MTAIVEMPQGSAASAFLQRRLLYGAGLSAKLAEITTSGGRIFSAVPQNTTVERAEEFEEGGLLSRTRSVQWLEEHLKKQPIGLFVVQDLWARPSDDLGNNLGELGIKRLSGSTGIYYVAWTSELTVQKIELIFSRLISYFSVCALVGVTNIEDILDADGSLEMSSTEQIRQVFISAYDEEGFVFWKRT